MTAFLFSYIVIVFVGTLIMHLGPKCKVWRALPMSRDEDTGEDAHRHLDDHRRLLVFVWMLEMVFILEAVILSLRSGRISKATGLDWEAYFTLFCLKGLELLAQAALAVRRIQPGRVFALTAFVQGTVTGMWPFISDSYDMLKDVIFCALCWSSASIALNALGVLAFVYLIGLHAFLILDTHGLVALTGGWLPVLNAEAKEPKQLSTLGITDLLLSMVYEQVNPSKRRLLLMENLPQAAVAFVYFRIEGGSAAVVLLGFVIPLLQMVLGSLLHSLLQNQLGPWFGHKLNLAIDAGSMPLERRWREEASFAENIELFRKAAPCCKHFVKTFPTLRETDALSEDQLNALQLACEFITSDVSLSIQRLQLSACDRAWVEALVTAYKAGDESNNPKVAQALVSVCKSQQMDRIHIQALAEFCKPTKKTCMNMDKRPLESEHIQARIRACYCAHCSLIIALHSFARIIATSTDVNPNCDLSYENKGMAGISMK